MSRLVISLLVFAASFSQASPSPIVDPALRLPGETLAGVVDYKGGFAKLELTVALKDIVRSFRVAVPKYCKDVEILEAGTVTEGVFDEAKLVSETDHTYSVNGGAGLRVSGVRLTTNGPATSVCAIPVFLSAKKATVVTDPGDDPALGTPMRANICNKSAQKASLALGFNDGSQWMAQGWWDLAPGQCNWFTVRGNPSYSLYLHGRTPSGTFWGKGHAQFCVTSAKFRGGEELCTLEKGGFRVPMTKLTRQWDGNVYMDLL